MILKPHHPFRSEKAKQRYLKRYCERAAAWPVPSEERMVDTSYGKTFVRVSGPSDASPVVMLPGIGSPGLLFAANVADLSREFQIFVVDNIHDVGLSVESHPIKGVDDFTVWFDELCTGLGFGRQANLIGLSYGGWIAAHYALRFPDRVRRLVLLAPAGTAAPVSWGFIWRGILCLLPV
nr:alpha/beta fold hydrolase [Syntrophales bacterium]